MKLDELELVQLFRQPGGKEFVRFCNEVIRTTCWAHGVPQSEVSTTLRTDIADGGVDTRVGRGISDDKFGYFETPSVWQFKAADQAGLRACRRYQRSQQAIRAKMHRKRRRLQAMYMRQPSSREKNAPPDRSARRRTSHKRLSPGTQGTEHH